MEQKVYTLNDGREIQLRSVETHDKKNLLGFCETMSGYDIPTCLDLDNVFRYPLYYINLVIIHDDKIVGYGEIMKSPDMRDGELKIHIHGDYQGAGLGTAMMIMLVHEATDEQLHSIHLRVDSSNLGAIHLFRKSGFIEETIEKETINGKQIETLHMIRTLTR
ncbi:MAG: GNAT family N-acetyltransferase [Candidatus Bathyarchaeota archaeon]|nr:GNAT family N-acetyltransferase [Candidatus Bathyarchaeota archaeon]